MPVLTAFLRYALILEQGRGAAPEEVFASDRVLQILGVLWVIVFGLGGVHVMERTFDEAWDAVADVEGWMTRDQGEALYEAASNCPHGGRIVEIGSFHGRSTIVLASAAPDGARCTQSTRTPATTAGQRRSSGYADAAADDHADFLANLARRRRERARAHLRMFSDAALAAIDGPVDVLYVDGAHRYAPARADIHDWGDASRRAARC